MAGFDKEMQAALEADGKKLADLTGEDHGPDFIDDDGDDDEYDWLDQECHLNDDGQCGLAGTEHCDFECPYRDSELFAGSEAWHKKHETPT